MFLVVILGLHFAICMHFAAIDASAWCRFGDAHGLRSDLRCAVWRWRCKRVAEEVVVVALRAFGVDALVAAARFFPPKCCMNHAFGDVERKPELAPMHELEIEDAPRFVFEIDGFVARFEVGDFAHGLRQARFVAIDSRVLLHESAEFAAYLSARLALVGDVELRHESIGTAERRFSQCASIGGLRLTAKLDGHVAGTMTIDERFGQRV